MNKVLIILKHEFRQKVRSKAFIIMTVLAPVLLALMSSLPIIISYLGGSQHKKVLIVDQTGKLNSYFVTAKENPLAKDTASAIVFSFLEYRGTDSKLLDSLKAELASKNLDAYLVIPASAISDTTVVATLRMANTNDFATEEKISTRYEEGLFNERMKQSAIDPAIVRSAQSAHKIETLKVAEGKEANDNGIGFAAGYITGFFIYLSMILYGSIIMQSVIEEKSSRVIELLASCARPIDILIGKVLGVGLAGLVQVAVWAVMFLMVGWFALPAIMTSAGATITTLLSPGLFLYFILYFCFGYLIYATLYAGAGATAEQASDAQQVTLPITILIIVPFVTISNVIQEPSSTLSTVLSLIPFFSPVLMMGRIFSETPPLWQILLSFVLMTATFFGVLWVSARVYRTGILMYGKKYSLKEIIKWIRFS